MSDTIQNKMLKRLLWRLWLTDSRDAMWVSYYPLHKPASSWFSLGFFHSFPLTFQTKFQVRSHDIYCTTFPHINFVVWHSWKMRTNFDARSSREEQPIVATFTLLTFFSFSHLCYVKNKLVKWKLYRIQKGYRQKVCNYTKLNLLDRLYK